MSEDILDAHERRIGENAEAIAYIKRRLNDIEQVVDTGMGAIQYEQMTRKDKVRQIRSHLYDEATASKNGKAAMNYREVRTLFNGRPSAGTAYNLMEAAATVEGIEYDERTGANNRLLIDMTDVNDLSVFQPVNNETEKETA